MSKIAENTDVLSTSEQSEVDILARPDEFAAPSHLRVLNALLRKRVARLEEINGQFAVDNDRLREENEKLRKQIQ